MDWVPRGIEELSRTAAFHTDFTFDRTMLQVAGGMMYGGEADVQHAIARLNGISVHSYRYSAAGMYDPRRLDRVREQYRAAGWKHMVSAESHGLYNNTGRTDLWIETQGINVTGMVLLLATEKNLNLIAINGNLSPVDLLHLRGHFGIPKFEGDRFVPPGSRPGGSEVAPQARAYPPPPLPEATPGPPSAVPEKPSPYGQAAPPPYSMPPAEPAPYPGSASPSDDAPAAAPQESAPPPNP